MALIYDVGVHNGADSAYYLHLGYKVIGVEASPVMASALTERFAQQIADGTYILLNVGVGPTEGELEFWVSDQSEWSSFNRAIASRDGKPHKSVVVETRTFASILKQFGPPHYCKIDIEGNDRLCLLGMTKATAPRYVSIEMSHSGGGEDLSLLSSLGYDRFKIVSQVTRAEASRLYTWASLNVPPRLAKLLRKAWSRAFGVTRSGTWQFPWGSSGPFGEETPGTWRSLESAMATWQFLSGIDQRYSQRGLGEWFDIHATRKAT